MISAEFTQHIRFALQHLFEISVLDRGPSLALAPWLDQVSEPSEQVSAGQRLHQVLMQTIEQMKPTELLDPNLPRHRTYLILKRRYIDGAAVQQLETEFSSSSRQFRRDNHRAIEELVLALWNLLPQTAKAASLPLASAAPTPTRSVGTLPAHSGPLAEFSRSISAVNLLDMVVDAAQTLAGIINAAQTQVIADIPSDLPLVTADRVALRLALIKLLRLCIAHAPQRTLRLRATPREDMVVLRVENLAGLDSADTLYNEAAQLFALTDGALSLETRGAAESDIILHLSTQQRPTVLVVDDDPAMPRIIQRYLALKPIKVISCNSTNDVVQMARETQPMLILLDVLMPKRDGWEILQELKANPDTYHIHLAVCSIWDEHELALSLGADMFFQKPIGRTELLECVEKHLH
jgi:CheY-like chemotaxis protein